MPVDINNINSYNKFYMKNGLTADFETIYTGLKICNDVKDYNVITRCYSKQTDMCRVFYGDFPNIDTFVIGNDQKLIVKNKAYHYAPFNEKRGILYYFNLDKKLESIPTLFKNINKTLSSIKFLPENSVLEIPVSVFRGRLAYKHLTRLFTVAHNFNYRKLRSVDLDLDVDFISMNILRNCLNIRTTYLSKFLRKNIDSIKIRNNYLIIKLDSKSKLRIFSRLFTDLETLLKSLGICYSMDFKENSLIIIHDNPYNLIFYDLYDCESTLINIKYIEYLGSKLQNRFQLSGNSRYLLDTGIVMSSL